MTKDELDSFFGKHGDEYLKGDIEGPRDLAAFNLLHKLVPSKKDIIAASEHDEFWLSVDREAVAEVATEEDVIFLIRCGVMLDDFDTGFSMFS